MNEAAVVGFVLATVAVTAVQRIWPYLFAPLAIVPVLRPARIALSASAAARLLARAETPQTYRSASPVARVDWAALGGNAIVDKDAIALRIEAPKSRVVAWSKRGWGKTVVCVDVRADSDGLLLRARHIPDGLWILAMLLAIGLSGFDVRRYVYLVGLAVGIISLAVSFGRARDALAIVAAELKARTDVLESA